MRKELDEALCAKYPEIFRDRNGDMRTTAMCWGFECGDGWYNIIDGLCATIQNREYNQKLNKKEFAPVVAAQVKEKYGTLRFYYSGGDDYIDGAVSMAEYMSEVTCEKCGAPGKLQSYGWAYTACDEHTRDEDKENE
jgi:hypothetical protein